VALLQAEESALHRWTDAGTRNEFVRCDSKEDPPRVLITDASEWGWGALYLDANTGAALSHSAPWSPEDRISFDVRRSAYAEPEAVFRAVCRFVRPGDKRPIAIVSDSTTARFALEKGHSQSFVINAIINRLYTLFPHTDFRFHYVPGEHNGADALSRDQVKELTAAQVRALAKRSIVAAGAPVSLKAV
jgi:hypothetical protein